MIQFGSTTFLSRLSLILVNVVSFFLILGNLDSLFSVYTLLDLVMILIVLVFMEYRKERERRRNFLEVEGLKSQLSILKLDYMVTPSADLDFYERQPLPRELCARTDPRCSSLETCLPPTRIPSRSAIEGGRCF